jgi:DNA-binding NtrC family response regulator
MASPYVLVVDDEPDIRQLVQEILQDEGYEVVTAENGEVARTILKSKRPDLILLDIWMPDVDGITLLQEWSKDGVLPYPVIMISGHGTVETAVEATRLGAYDFIEKPISLAKLLVTIERALESEKLKRENVNLKSHGDGYVEPMGKSTIMNTAREQAQQIAAHDTRVLIYGEPGSGKKTFAKYMHMHSQRKDGPFIEMGAGAIAKENSAVELFGSESGETVHYGKLEQANGGTLYLDEIGDMDYETQTRLTSALESESFIRIGGAEPVKVNVRIIASTHEDLAEKVNQGSFREDLFYHLNVVPFKVPSLHEHPEDVSEYLNFYVDYFVEREGLPYRRFSVAAQNRLRNHAWPGNVRELKNLVQRLLILGGTEDIGVEDIEQALQSVSSGKSRTPQIDNNVLELPLREAREQFEREYLLRQLKACGGSVGELAKLVGMERTNLYRKLRSLGIDVKQK